MTVEQLRNSLLQEAISGRLVPQDPNDEPATAILSHINAEKKRLVKISNLKKYKAPASIAETEVPYEVPSSWQWVRLSTLCTLITKGTTPRGGNVAYVDEGIGFLRAENISGIDRLDLSNLKYIDKTTNDGYLKRSILQENDLLITIAGTLGRTAIVRKEDLPLNANQAVCLCRWVDVSSISLKYIAYALNAPAIQSMMLSLKKITAIPNLTLEIISDTIIPLPPLAEQKRIVEKLEELLPIVEEYGKAQKELEDLNEELPTRLRQSVLQEAIMGKLVQQDKDEEPASALLSKLQNVKQQLIKEKKVKAKDLLSKSLDTFEPKFELPDGWEWVRLNFVANIARGGSPRPIKEYLTTKDDGYNWIKIGDTEKGGKYINQTAEKIKPEGVRHSRIVNPGDFLLTNSMSFGRPYISNIRGCIHDGWLVISQYTEVFDKDYLYYLLSSKYTYEQFCDVVSGAVVKNLNSDKVAESVFPLPPLAEQKRIVAKLEELLPQIDQLAKL